MFHFKMGYSKMQPILVYLSVGTIFIAMVQGGAITDCWANVVWKYENIYGEAYLS